ncbi:hypothetical protein LR48_Vigan03g201300 [Vigna angularis]|uniref:Uncharacterized protein n=1 Tax=Phaseolus angularis TaxID=3914 RepID=A0A0L9U795_PHAAN|nr:hypothetical protein LR48_Vigan03g201300 [Vigna angularis]
MFHTHVLAKCYTLQLQVLEMPQDQGVNFPADLHPDLALLYNYKSIFDKPFGLSPDRSHNH